MPPSAAGSALVAHHRAPRLPLRLLLVPILILACGEGEPDVVAPAPVPTTLAITPPSAVLASLGQTVQLTATVRDQAGALMTGVAVNWASSDGGVATVDASGLVTAVEDGAANITATVRGGGASGSAAITVEQQIVEVRLTPDPRVFSAIGQTLQMSAEALDANGHPVQTARVTWSSSDEAVVTVSDEGLVTATGNGDATVTATAGSEEAAADFSVQQEIAEIRLTPDPEPFRALGDRLQMAADVLDELGNPVDGAGVTWASSDESVITVTSTGLVSAVGNGRAGVSASSGSVSATAAFIVEQEAVSVHVTPSSATLFARRDTLQLAAEAFDANDNLIAAAEFMWLSSDPSVAEVSSGGRVVAREPGSVEITVHLAGSAQQATAELLVVFPDRSALAALYDATGGADWRDSENWLTDASLRHWHGVGTNREGRVISLVMRDNGLRGSLPGELALLDELEFIDFTHNELEGPIPREIGELRNLVVLTLDENSLTGPIPAELGDISGLNVLSLAGNQLSGSIPRQLANIAELRIFQLHENQLSGSIPPEFGRLKAVYRMRLCCNSLAGLIPRELGRMSALNVLELHHNQLSGTLPSALAEIPQLFQLDVGANRGLIGAIPREYVRFRLTHFIWNETGLCSPADRAFQEWLAGIPQHEGGAVCSASTRR